MICLQDELPVVLVTTLDLETFIKGHYVHKEVEVQKNGQRKRMFELPEVRINEWLL